LTSRAESILSWRERALPGLLFAALVIAVYADPLLVRRNFCGRDLVVYNLPMEMSVHDAYSRGKLPVWSPEISGGRPIIPNPNAGALYPPRAGLGFLSFPSAVRVFPVFHWIAAGLGVLVLLRAIGVSRAGSWIGAVTYTLSGVGVSEVFFPHIHPGMALLPWTVWAVARRGTSPGVRLLLLSFLFGLMFLAADVFTSGMAIVSCALWILVEEDRSERAGALVLLVLALVLAALIALPQILATSLWIPETNRAVLGMKVRDSLFFSIHPLRLLELVVPYPLGFTWTLESSDIWGWSVFRGKAMGLFSSLYAGAFAVIALVTGWKLSSRGANFARWLFALALIVSVLPSLVPVSWERLPSPIPLRNPEKFAVAWTFALALFAGLALDRFRRLGWPRWILAVAAGLCLLAIGLTFFGRPLGRWAVGAIQGDPKLAEVAARQMPRAVAEAGLLWIATLIAVDRLRRPRRADLVAGLALLTLVPIEANRKIARTLPEQEVFAPSPFARRLEHEDPQHLYRTAGVSLYRGGRSKAVIPSPDDEYTDRGRRSWVHYAPVLWHRGMVFNFDFDVGDFSRVESLRKFSVIAAEYPSGKWLFGSLALRWAIRFRDQDPLPGYRPIGGDLLQEWDELPSARPAIRLIEAWREETSALDALNTVPRLSDSEIVLETGRRAAGRARPGTVRVLEDRPEALRAEVNSPDATWLFVLRGYWPYRTIEVDGRPVEAVPAQVAYSAIAVPPGRHTIEWRERVPGIEVSRWGPLLFLPLAIGLIARDRNRRRRRLH
jgi:hypothetical protein